MWVAYLAWFLAAPAAGVTAGMLWQHIVDEVEEALPLEQRPSWRVFPWPRAMPWVYLDIHRQTRPGSRLRGRFGLAAACAPVVFFGGTAALAGMARH